ncbi:P-loop containing nucleoside triphosphate hydrolase protein [Obelidium mucronatum]|nr:P-loop containing nucleoside triphosphate hydrolase protein [Obelidium mucronatum]
MITMTSKKTVSMDPWSFVTVSWMTRLILLGAKKDLAGEDLPELRPQDLAANTHDWVAEVSSKKSEYCQQSTTKTSRQLCLGRSQSSLPLLWIVSGLIFLISIAAMVGIPLVLQQDSHLYTKSSLNLAFLLLGLKAISTIFGRVHDMITKRIAFQIRTVLINAIVKKSLSISTTRATEFSKGYVLNLINVDSESVSLAAEQIHQVWGVPMQIIAAISLLSVLVGSSIGAGIGALMASLILLGGVVPVLMGTSIPKMVILNDTRVKIIREVLDGIRLIKIRSLGSDFTAQISKVRTEQLAWLRMVLFGVVCFVVVGQLAASIMPVATFTLYAVRGNAMAASVVFPASALFNMLVNPLIQLPNVLNALVTAIIAWKRIYNFLIAEDRETTPTEPSSEIAIHFDKASLNWPCTAQTKVENGGDKEDFKCQLRRGSLSPVVGQVGSGKSSFLSSILGELHKTSGSVTTNGSITAPATMDSNWNPPGKHHLRFSTRRIKSWLKQFKCTCFEMDLAAMPSGIQTILGEKGTSVSGGQKTRISLARAVYSNADIYLLDDPLSSLDAKVSKTVFMDCFKKELKGKSIVLATHNHDILKDVDRILFLTAMGEGLDDTKLGVAGGKTAASGYSSQLAVAGGGAGVDPLSVITEEESETGNVKWTTYMRYIQASGGWGRVSLLVATIILFQATGVLLNQWLSWWTEDLLLGQKHDVYFWSLWFNLLAWIGVIFLVLMNLIILGGNYEQYSLISRNSIWPLLTIVLLPLVFQFIAGIGGLLSILVVLAINSPWLLLGVIPFDCSVSLLCSITTGALCASLKRLESTQRSPLYSHVSESLEGIPTILAYKKEEFGAELWIMLRLELFSIGVALLYTNSMTALMNLILQSAANVETEMVCVERLVEYAEKLPKEGEARLPQDPSPQEWPQSGAISFEKVSAFYRSKPDVPVLKEISLEIKSGEKVCVVGRTGSGKSTMISVLLKFVVSTGVSKIDGRDINSIGLQTLRDTMEVIPQDIFLFSGTMRTTLDRSNQFTDAQLWDSLALVGMKGFVSNLDKRLETPITNGGSNLSLGQRQLLYFARMLLLKPKIILMDEATSSVDPDSENTLRRVIKEQFVGTTIVAVLHRLQTSVLDDFDKVLVMDQGNIAEYDSPRVLLNRNGSIFASLYSSMSSE